MADGGLTDTHANAILNDLFDGTHYLGLFTTSPSDSSAGTEVATGSYARMLIPAATASGRSVTNDEVIESPEATAGWGTIVGFGIFAASSGGSALWWGDWETPRDIITGEVFRVAVSALALTIAASPTS